MAEYAPRILIVEDEARVGRLFEQVLSEDGYNVSAVGNGRHAFHLLRQREFDLVITDMSLPDFDGYELIRDMIAEFPHLRVLAISGAIDQPMEVLARRAGARALFHKPISPKEVCDAVYNALDPSGKWKAVD
jgi:two-component system response regulator HydG